MFEVVDAPLQLRLERLHDMIHHLVVILDNTVLISMRHRVAAASHRTGTQFEVGTRLRRLRDEMPGADTQVDKRFLHRRA